MLMRAARRIAFFLAALVSVLTITEGTTQVEQSDINKAKMDAGDGGSGVTWLDSVADSWAAGRPTKR